MNKKGQTQQRAASSESVRLQRALEDVDKLKATITKLKTELRDGEKDRRTERDKLDQRCKRLERQKAEVLAAFRKQMKLIDILKRQKVHMEAARLLNFTEEEFMRVVNWDDGAEAPVDTGGPGTVRGKRVVTWTNGEPRGSSLLCQPFQIDRRRIVVPIGAGPRAGVAE